MIVVVVGVVVGVDCQAGRRDGRHDRDGEPSNKARFCMA